MTKNLKEEKNKFIKDKIIEVSKDIVSKKGFDGLSIRKIAKEVGYSPGNIYQYFDNKEEIILEILKSGYLKIIKSLNIEIKEKKSIKEIIMFKFENYLSEILKRPNIYKFIMLSSNPKILKYTSVFNRKNIDKNLSSGIKLLEKELKNGVEKKEIRNINTKELSKVLWASIFGIIIKNLVEKNYNKKNILEEINLVINTFFAGIEINN
ncbi:MAG: TetR/AcrR family transcriptional regulator [Bacillota bacterium]